ncbi:MAG TPA: hypothetical protein PLL69_06170 [Gemmatimonadales bacterium]|nr:hypothetical protein [Gemmatimonadales bacterium]
MAVIRLLLLASVVPALFAFAGALLATPFGGRTMFVVATVAGTFGVLAAVRLAIRMGWLDPVRLRGPAIGAQVGLGLGAPIAAMSVDQPLAIAIGSLLVGIGTVVGGGRGAAR